MDEENKIDPSEYTLRKFLEDIIRIIEANPDKVNATIDGIASMYDDGNGDHCIIGEFLSQNGLLAEFQEMCGSLDPNFQAIHVLKWLGFDSTIAIMANEIQVRSMAMAEWKELLPRVNEMMADLPGLPELTE